MTDQRSTPESQLIPTSLAQRRYASWMTDVLVYTVVLILFVEYSDAIVIDSFTISILTAVLLKALLDVIVGVEHRVRSWFQRREGAVYRLLGPVTMFLILFLSKLLILEVVDVVFGDHVELGHFLDVLVLILAMMITRRVLVSIYDRLGPDTADD